MKTGYPSIDRPWEKYYSEEAKNLRLPGGSAYQYIWEKNKDHLDDTALIYFGHKITYKQLFMKIDNTANALLKIGVKKGDVVAVMLPNIPENIFCVYGLNKIGAVADMIDLRSKGEELKYYLSESNASVTFICTLFAENTFEILEGTHLKKIIAVSVFDSLPVPIKQFMKIKEKNLQLPEIAITWKDFLKGPIYNEAQSIGAKDDAACIFHTSGTTGTPKGVLLSNQAFNAMALSIAKSGLKFNYGEKMMNQVPPFLAYNALCATHMPLSLHMEMIMLPEYRPDKFAANIIKLKPNCAIAGPADWNNFLVEPKMSKKTVNLSYLVSLISGSDSISQKNKDAINLLVKQKGCREAVIEGYGMTEIGSAACANLPQHNVDGSVGIPLPLNNFCIYDNEQDVELPYGELGEICMTGPTLMQGYYNKPTETSEVLRRHKDGLLWLHSGDLGYISEDGNVFLEGRIKRILIRHDGIKVSPFSLEKTIMKHQGVKACCVVGAPDEIHNSGQIPVAFVVLKNDDESIIPELQALCEKELAPDHLPKRYVPIASLPLTPNGKVDHRAMEEMASRDLKQSKK